MPNIRGAIVLLLLVLLVVVMMMMVVLVVRVVGLFDVSVAPQRGNGGRYVVGIVS